MTQYRDRLTVLERAMQGVLGKPFDRTDGPAKVAGSARYSYEVPADGMLYGVIVTATIGRGHVEAIDTSAAEGVPGVVAAIFDDPRLPGDSMNSAQMGAWRLGREVRYFGQALGVVVAESFEAAREGAGLVRLSYAPGEGKFVPNMAEPDDPAPKSSFIPPVEKGDMDAAFAGAAYTYDEYFTTPVHFPAAMEPQATTAMWDGDKLTVHSSLQAMNGAQRVIANALDIAPEQVRVLAPFVGGGFGGKTSVGAEAVIAAITAEATGRPVKIAQPRRQLGHLAHHRPQTRQRIRLAVGEDGVITALGHNNVVVQREGRGFVEPPQFGTMHLYAGAARSLTVGVSYADLPTAGAVRSPGEAPGTMALEVAMDEAAEALELDPIEFRRRNEPAVSPVNGKPFATRRLLDCYDEGARRFGWERRNPRPGQTREGDWLIGMGMAAAVRGNFTVEARARVRLEPDGTAVVETDMTDIGTGTYTVLMQVAAEALGLAPEQVRVEIGDSDLPVSAGSGGSFGAHSSGSAVALACAEIAGTIAARMGASPEDLTLQDGHATALNRRVPLSDVLGGETLEAVGHAKPGPHTSKATSSSYGAHFAEVAVNAVTGETRVRRMVGVFDVGRVLNRKTARSQLLGGMIWGIGSMLHEEGVIDPRTGQFVNPDFGEYHIATHADAPPIEVHFVEEIDEQANEVGAKGVGELGNSGAGAAIANAIYNACGVRVRDFPITLDKLLNGLPDV